VADSDVHVVEQAANAIAMNAGCASAVYDKLLDALDATYKAGKLSGYIASKLLDFQRSKRKATDAQIRRAEETIKTTLGDAKVAYPTRATLIDGEEIRDELLHLGRVDAGTVRPTPKSSMEATTAYWRLPDLT
jgi:hypothetical protein